MNPDYFGDSYDLVKRFFCAELRSLGYSVAIEPMLTGEWGGSEANFYRLVGAAPRRGGSRPEASAVFFDPDTGVHSSASRKHVSIGQIAAAADEHELVFSFDQSFSRQHKAAEVMRDKLASLAALGCVGMYYDSHARFLFASRQERCIASLRLHLTMLGLPGTRLVGL